MDKRRDTGGPRPPQATVILRLIAGGYLVYLAHDLFKIYLNPAEGGEIYQLGCAAFFFAAGAGLAVWAGMKLVKGDYVKNGEREEDANTQADADAGTQADTAAEDAPEAAGTGKIEYKYQEEDGNDRS